MDTNEIKFEKGVEYLRSSEFNQALKVFNQLIDKDPNNAKYLSERGVVYFHLKKKKEALNDLDKAVELEPHKPYRYSSRAYVKGHYKMTAEAIKDYEKAIELDPQDAVAINNLGMLQEQLGYKKEAKNYFQIADKLSKDYLGDTDLGVQGTPIESRNIQKEIDEENKNNSFLQVFKSLTTKKGRISFINFIKSGFKLN